MESKMLMICNVFIMWGNDILKRGRGLLPLQEAYELKDQLQETDDDGNDCQFLAQRELLFLMPRTSRRIFLRCPHLLTWLVYISTHIWSIVYAIVSNKICWIGWAAESICLLSRRSIRIRQFESGHQRQFDENKSRILSGLFWLMFSDEVFHKGFDSFSLRNVSGGTCFGELIAKFFLELKVLWDDPLPLSVFSGRLCLSVCHRAFSTPFWLLSFLWSQNKWERCRKSEEFES